MEYNYILNNLASDFYQHIYIPLQKESNVLIHRHGIDSNSIVNKVFFIHWSHRINEIIHLPFKEIWFHKMYSNNFRDNKPICFVFWGGKYITESDKLRKYILKRNPENKCIIYCGDLIAKKNWDIDKVKKCCDAIVTYDPSEAEKYDIYCFNKPIYGRIAPLTTPDKFEYDIYFLGFAKDRLSLIRDVYKKLTSAGLRCKFIVCGVKKEEQEEDGIDYGAPIPYVENINYLNKSKCVLELIQGGSNTATLRREEAIVYKRKLLTNYLGMSSQDYYNSKYMSVFSKAEDIDLDFIREPIDYSAFQDERELAPVKLLEFFDQVLKKEQQ